MCDCTRIDYKECVAIAFNISMNSGIVNTLMKFCTVLYLKEIMYLNKS